MTAIKLLPIILHFKAMTELLLIMIPEAGSNASCISQKEFLPGTECTEGAFETLRKWVWNCLHVASQSAVEGIRRGWLFRDSKPRVMFVLQPAPAPPTEPDSSQCYESLPSSLMLSPLTPGVLRLPLQAFQHRQPRSGVKAGCFYCVSHGPAVQYLQPYRSQQEMSKREKAACKTCVLHLNVERAVS